MAFPDSFLRELSDRNEISEVVSEYVRLTKRSGSNLFGLCPFHSEKTPSFAVSPEKQIYHCFGCGKGGSVINFIMEIENLSFADAVRFLARRAGMQVPEDGEDPRLRDKRDRMLNLNREAARFFHRQLLAPDGQRARDYVDRRGISAAMVKSFGLGFAPDSWDSLIRAMTALGYSRRSGIPYGIGLIKNKYIGRTFIAPDHRLDQVRIKLSAIEEAVGGKRVVLIDDSIVRGTTSGRIVALLRDAGARQVHMRVSAPPFLFPCYYGTDIDSQEHLIACRHTVPEIAAMIGADSLGYLPRERLFDLAPGRSFCSACFGGAYPTPIPADTRKDRFERRLSEIG